MKYLGAQALKDPHALGSLLMTFANGTAAECAAARSMIEQVTK